MPLRAELHYLLVSAMATRSGGQCLSLHQNTGSTPAMKTMTMMMMMMMMTMTMTTTTRLLRVSAVRQRRVFSPFWLDTWGRSA
jgi:hypothetical protein